MRARAPGLVPLCAALLTLVACQAPFPTARVVPAPGGSVVEALYGGFPGALNPLFEVEDNARDIDSLIYQGLTAVRGDQSAAPLLARSWSISDDRLSYTFELRRDVRWADGQPFTADDVMFTFGVLRSPEYEQQTMQFWREIQVEKPADYQVRFTLKAPSASFPLALREGIVPRHLFAGVPVKAMAADVHSSGKALGTGPFKVGSLSRDRRTVTLDRNPFSNPRPYLDHVSFRTYPTLGDAVDAVSRGEADTVGALQPPQLGSLTTRQDLAVRQLKTFSFSAVLFNISPELSVYFNPPAVRQALVQAVDRRKIISGVLEGRADPAPGAIPPTDWAYSGESAARFPYDPKAAARTLDEAGWKLNQQTGLRNRQGRDFSVSLVTADAFPYRQVAQSVSAQLREIGVEVKVDPVPASVLVGKYVLGRTYQMALVAFDNGPDPDQYSLWHSGAPKDSLNFASPLVPRQALIDKDLEDGRAAPDRKTRRAAYADFQDLMQEATPAIFLFEPHYAYVVSNRVKGVLTNAVVDPVDRFQYVAGWYVETRGQ
ncbi:MAG: peptide ABC transporter substrate-binding protein [Candidatus Dormibacteraeota bacterium]|jgi:peptide/nickel transport system substrate-binding protein|nr:peptide ABC transporter substrate-binding protein [Candidatus Dormibacteraeota bacterium]